MSYFSAVMDTFDTPYPAGPDVFFSTFLVGVVALNLVAVALTITGLISGLISVSRHRGLLGGSELALWVAIVTFAPVLGVIAWFTIGRTRAREIAHGGTSPETATPPAENNSRESDMLR